MNISQHKNLSPQQLLFRDVDEMTDVGFKAVARQLCVGHAHSWPIRYLEVDVRWPCLRFLKVGVFKIFPRLGQLKKIPRWGEPVEVFGQRVEPGQLVHADKHGFIAIQKGWSELI